MEKLIAAIILTYNEEKHIGRCIKSLHAIVDEIFVVDSYSTDRTVEIANSLGARVLRNKWINYATQFNWALTNCPINSTWVWRIDADEYLENPEPEIRRRIESLPPSMTGVYVKKKMVFLGKELLHGGWYPVWHLKIWRHGKGYCENRWMDEHIKVTEGTCTKINCTQVDRNLNDLSWWTDKHNSYASREMIDMFHIKFGISSQDHVIPRFFGTSEQRKRWLKIKYARTPLFIRPFLNFIIRYFFMFGFLDGKQGLIWHLLQGFWYRLLVDTKIYEMSKRYKNDREQLIQHLKESYHTGSE